MRLLSDSTLLFLGFVLNLSSVLGQVSTWDGGTSGIGTSWNTATNWAGDVAPASGNDLLFDSSNGTGLIISPMSLSANRIVGLITFDNVNSKLPTSLRIDANGSGGTTTRTLTVNTGITTKNYTGNVSFSESTNGTLLLSLGSSNLTIDTQSTSSININGVINEGAAGRGITKTGTGYLVLANANTFSGAVVVNGGSLFASNLTGSGTGSGAMTVNSGGTLGGFGTVTGATTVNSGGTIRGDSITGTGTLTTGNVTVQNGGNIFANLAASSTSSKLSLGANTLDLKNSSILKLANVTGYNVTASSTWTIAQLTSGTTLLLNGAATNNGDQFGKYVQGSGNTGPVQIDVTDLPSLAVGDQLILSRTGNNLVLTFVPVPEPALLFGLAAGLMGVGAAVRKKFFSMATVA
jgi:autotransporter-associated beta strand protein